MSTITKSPQMDSSDTTHKLDSTSLNPIDYEVFQTRFKSYTISNWSCMPIELSPVACSKRGWRYEKAATLKCDFCNKRLNVILPRKDYEFFKRSTSVLEEKLTSEHRTGCIWKSKLNPPDYFITGEIPGKPKFEEELLLNSETISKHIEKFKHIKVFVQAKDVEDNTELVESFSIKNKTDSTSLSVAAHGWNIRMLQSDATLSCAICSRQLPLWSKSDSLESFDLRRHLAWCPWIKAVSPHTPPLIQTMIGYIIEQMNRKRKRESLDYQSSQQRKEELKEISKFIRRSFS